MISGDCSEKYFVETIGDDDFGEDDIGEDKTEIKEMVDCSVLLMFQQRIRRGSEDLERRQEVAPAPERHHHSDTPRSLGFVDLGATTPKRHPEVARVCRAGSDLTQRHPEVARVCRAGSDVTTATPRHRSVPMVKKTKGKLDAEKQEAERKESALRGNDLASEPAGSGTHRTSRQQTLATNKSKEQ
ncbi:hypothetical protein F2Q68_00040107 [Brassica cretica]|uniref:Uncharacterized protein n=1 Tax=Brassica cretica TaxID=69181 RepID=A0A8S9MIC3_BRACR|nr:hypothetical protein F2Q68_00040107 [Brassica cretica]